MSEITYRVLVVDDNRVNRIKLVRPLKSAGYDVCEASGGREAVEVLRSRDCHLVLLDMLMPDIDGLQVLEQMQADQRLAPIPVIMVSAVDEKDDIRKCLAMGAVDYMTKPFDIDALKERVNSYLKRTPA